MNCELKKNVTIRRESQSRTEWFVYEFDVLQANIFIHLTIARFVIVDVLLHVIFINVIRHC